MLSDRQAIAIPASAALMDSMACSHLFMERHLAVAQHDLALDRHRRRVWHFTYSKPLSGIFGR
jgi:hypothetical protein